MHFETKKKKKDEKKILGQSCTRQVRQVITCKLKILNLKKIKCNIITVTFTFIKLKILFFNNIIIL